MDHTAFERRELWFAVAALGAHGVAADASARRDAPRHVAMQRDGLYVADIGTDLYVQGDRIRDGAAAPSRRSRRCMPMTSSSST